MKKFLMLLLAGLTITTTACGDFPETQANTNHSDTVSIASDSIVGEQSVNTNTTVGEVIANPAFEDFGRLLFPVDRTVTDDMTLAEVSTSRVYTWYNNIQPEKTVEIINTLAENAKSGQQIFYPIYSEAEMTADPSKRDTGLFFFKGEPGAKFAIMNAGGGFAYVGAMHDSFPHALEVSKMGYNAFALIYRPDDPYNDLTKAIEFIYDHAEELEVDTPVCHSPVPAILASSSPLSPKSELAEVQNGITVFPVKSLVSINASTGHAAIPHQIG